MILVYSLLAPYVLGPIALSLAPNLCLTGYRRGCVVCGLSCAPALPYTSPSYLALLQLAICFSDVFRLCCPPSITPSIHYFKCCVHHPVSSVRISSGQQHRTASVHPQTAWRFLTLQLQLYAPLLRPSAFAAPVLTTHQQHFNTLITLAILSCGKLLRR